MISEIVCIDHFMDDLRYHFIEIISIRPSLRSSFVCFCGHVLAIRYGVNGCVLLVFPDRYFQLNTSDGTESKKNDCITYDQGYTLGVESVFLKCLFFFVFWITLYVCIQCMMYICGWKGNLPNVLEIFQTVCDYENFYFCFSPLTKFCDCRNKQMSSSADELLLKQRTCIPIIRSMLVELMLALCVISTIVNMYLIDLQKFITLF